jgi:hypothetical protein
MSALQGPRLIDGGGRVSDLCDLDRRARKRSCDNDDDGQEERRAHVGLVRDRILHHGGYRGRGLKGAASAGTRVGRGR